MSILQLPRINFQGEVHWDPCTVNNYDALYDSATAEPVQPDNPDGSGKLPWSDFVPYITGLDGGALRGGWSVYGDHAVSFHDVSAVSAVGPDGKPRDPDPALGKTMTLYGESFAGAGGPGRLVDINPYGSTSSQIFFDKLIFGDGATGVTGDRAVRMCSRWFFMGRNRTTPTYLPIAGRMGVLFQCGLPKASLAWGDKAGDSPILAALRDAVEQDPDCQGLLFRFSAYRTLYYQLASYKGARLDTAETLSKAYKDGYTGPNPAVSLLTGSLGLWGKDELSSGPTDRFLVPTKPAVGPASARLDRARKLVAVDAINLVPEAAEDHPHGQPGDWSVDKVDLGALSLKLTKPDGTDVPIGSPLAYQAYDKAAYRKQGGILEFDLGDVAPDDVDAGQLSLHAGDDGEIGRERTLMAEADGRGCYVDEGESRQVTVRVYDRGTPVADGRAKVRVTQCQLQPHLPLRWQPQTGIAVEPGTQQPLDRKDLDVTGGTATYEVASGQAGTCYLAYAAYPADQAPPALDGGPETDGYTALRALPFDNQLEQNIADGELSWKRLYETVLRTWDLIYPVMSQVRDLHSRPVFDAMAQQVRFAVDPQHFDTGWYMPITRDLSAGKRKLILRYLNLLPNNVPPDEPAQTS